MRLAGLIAAMLTIGGAQPAMSAVCALSIAAGDLSAQNFKLSYITMNKHDRVMGDIAAVDAFYFVGPSCECGFPAPEGVAFTKSEVAAAASGGKGLLKLATKLANVSGICPMDMTNSPFFHCLSNASKPCKEANQ